MAKKTTRSGCTPLNLERFGPFLINSLTRRFNARLEKAFRGKGLSIHDWRLLATLANAGLKRPADIAEYIATDPSTLSRMIDRFEKSGALVRRKPAGEARVTELELTKIGCALYESALEIIARECERLQSALTVKEGADLARLLSKVYRSYEPSTLSLPGGSRSAA